MKIHENLYVLYSCTILQGVHKRIPQLIKALLVKQKQSETWFNYRLNEFIEFVSNETWKKG